MHSGSGPTVLPSGPYKHRTGKHDSGSHPFPLSIRSLT